MDLLSRTAEYKRNEEATGYASSHFFFPQNGGKDAEQNKIKEPEMAQEHDLL